jgi:replicative DNA helicase
VKQSLYRQIEALYQFADTPVKRVGTGIRGIDELIVGPAPGEVCMVVGRSYSGKSIVGQQIVYNNPEMGSIFFSMEMPYMQALTRLYAMTNNVSAAHLQTEIESGNPPTDMWDLAMQYPRHVIIDEAAMSLSDMSEAVKEYERDYGDRPDFVVVDYLELLGGAKASGEGYLATEMQATMLKDWAKSEEMRVFVMHQANKQEPRWLPPTDSSARNGGYTEADFVIGMWRPHLDPKLPTYEAMALKDTVMFNVLKNRAFFKEADRIETWINESLRLEMRGFNTTPTRVSGERERADTYGRPDQVLPGSDGEDGF